MPTDGRARQIVGLYFGQGYPIPTGLLPLMRRHHRRLATTHITAHLGRRSLDSHPVNRTPINTAMATKMFRNRTLASVLRPQATVNGQAVRAFSVSAAQLVAMPKDAENMRLAPRDHIGTLKAPLVNPADKYQSKAESMHKYGTWLMGCLPKYIQQFSVWKDELTIYIPPSGVIPVFTFLKCMCSGLNLLSHIFLRGQN